MHFSSALEVRTPPRVSRSRAAFQAQFSSTRSPTRRARPGCRVTFVVHESHREVSVADPDRARRQVGLHPVEPDPEPEHVLDPIGALQRGRWLLALNVAVPPSGGRRPAL